MTARTVVKLVLLGLITVLAFVAVICSRFASTKKKKRNEQESLKFVVRVRMSCFLIMLVLVLICLII